MIRFFRILWYVLTMRCEEADRIRSVGNIADLKWRERIGESLHRLLCGSCWKAKRQLYQLKAITKSFRDQELGQLKVPAHNHCCDPVQEIAPSLDADAKQRILDELKKSL
ncbi:MAG: hypothetical protein H6815_13805 [Phycisphaeraceae bacterium]|nr:hypothetical protein [Phycisphaerales bacterium]MCB9861515.1 hypothetical protein [Phycisphaeraceae bacterium]